MSYAIEKNVPRLPYGRGAASDPNSFHGTLRRLAVGESIFAPEKTQSAASNFSVLRPLKFSVRSIEGGGIRVWRIA